VCGRVARAREPRDAVAQQRAAVRALERRIAVGKVRADVAEPGGAEQRVAQCVDRGVTVRVRDQRLRMWDIDAAEAHVVARPERVDIDPLTDADFHRDASTAAATTRSCTVVIFKFSALPRTIAGATP